MICVFDYFLSEKYCERVFINWKYIFSKEELWWRRHEGPRVNGFTVQKRSLHSKIGSKIEPSYKKTETQFNQATYLHNRITIILSNILYTLVCRYVSISVSNEVYLIVHRLQSEGFLEVITQYVIESTLIDASKPILSCP